MKSFQRKTAGKPKAEGFLHLYCIHHQHSGEAQFSLPVMRQDPCRLPTLEHEFECMLLWVRTLRHYCATFIDPFFFLGSQSPQGAPNSPCHFDMILFALALSWPLVARSSNCDPHNFPAIPPVVSVSDRLGDGGVEAGMGLATRPRMIQGINAVLNVPDTIVEVKGQVLDPF
jgi:hypothetical protein